MTTISHSTHLGWVITALDDMAPSHIVSMNSSRYSGTRRSIGRPGVNISFEMSDLAKSLPCWGGCHLLISDTDINEFLRSLTLCCEATAFEAMHFSTERCSAFFRVKLGEYDVVKALRISTSNNCLNVRVTLSSERAIDIVLHDVRKSFERLRNLLIDCVLAPEE